MCGIVGYLGKSSAANILINGLKRMEYRGYDSAGIAVLNDGIIKTTKKKGKVSELERMVDLSKESATIGIAHTRWATHGFPNDINAHPHSDQANKITIVHNGIIENYTAIKKKLTLDGYQFKSETDTEVLAVFIGALYERFGDLEYAVRFALSEVDGTFGILILSADHPDMLIAARRGSPLLIGIGDDEFVAASDAAAVIQYTKQVIYLNDNEIAVITRDGYHTKTISNVETISKIEQIEFDLEQIEKGGFEHFMLKEIFEQPETIQNAFRGRLLVDEGDVKLGGLRHIHEQLRSAERIIITACGTSWHAGLVGEYIIEHLANIPVEVEYASEFRYRNPVIKKNDIVLAISQSGETADTMAAVREAKQKGATVLGIVNVVGSSIARYTSAGVYTHAGPEIGVASTKAFTSQLTVLTLIAIMLGRMNTLSKYEGIKIAKELLIIPDKIKKIFESADKIQEIAKQHAKAKNFLYLGRGYNFPVALEGALKLKEISYIHAEGYPAAEMKHGPIALIDENMPVVFIATQDEIYEKIISNIEEVRARKGKIIAIATEGDTRIESVADNVIYIPETLPMLTPILSVIPFQLLAYYTALELDCDIDKPRNLAKSVTVE
ncbi:MAG: glutamine--fructose-6-phosphate transaminase (isomerizing) [Ignavibacteriae bacterium HGW-Ignavibacteriae-1]|jgi:glucosamine--fructose-6-phosphate aminotransferase (isomerizing)|nr:MAG: glutamine--fructose-6-phosphate transaminase (isomerizing) [Ignavibacteriae bacterium HGW-Ignavibacteriae-1]